jgi:hypothetical protein
MIEIKAPEAYFAGINIVGSPTKSEWFEEVLSLLTRALADQIRPVLRDVYDTHVAIYGEEITDEWNETLAESYAAEVPEHLRGLINEGFPFVDYITDAIVGWVIGEWRSKWSGRPGQFLAKFGVVASDYGEPHEPAQTVPMPPPLSTLATLIEVPEPAVTREEVAKAWVLFNDATTIDVAELARLLGISRSTVSNYGTGKTQGKCTAAQAAVLAALCHDRSVSLRAAGDVFAKVK